MQVARALGVALKKSSKKLSGQAFKSCRSSGQNRFYTAKNLDPGRERSLIWKAKSGGIATLAVHINDRVTSARKVNTRALDKYTLEGEIRRYNNDGSSHIRLGE